MMGPAPGTDRNQIEANGTAGMDRMVSKIDCRGLGKALLLRWAKGFQRLLDGAPRFHFCEDQERASPQHQIDLAKGCAITLG
jgi:hypothetical protein